MHGEAVSTKTYREIIADIENFDGFTLGRILEDHVGKENAIGRQSLVFEFNRCLHGNVHERKVRAIIHALRRRGLLVCSTPGEDGGYYLARDLAEFDEFCVRELHLKAIDMLETEQAMKRAARECFGDASQPGLL